MSTTAIVTVYDEGANDKRVIAFQKEMVEKFVPADVSFLQLDMKAVLRDLEEPEWAQSHPLLDGDHHASSFHAKCLDKCLYSLPYDHFIVLDSDAVPLSAPFFDFMQPRSRILAGAAHAANHLPEASRFIPYVSPSAMSITKQLYLDLHTSFAPDGPQGEWFDTGAWITIAAQRQAIPILLIYPTECLSPRWQVGRIPYGFVTSYGDLLCHMWASRGVATTVFEYYEAYVRMETERIMAAMACGTAAGTGAEAQQLERRL